LRSEAAISLRTRLLIGSWNVFRSPRSSCTGGSDMRKTPRSGIAMLAAARARQRSFVHAIESFSAPLRTPSW
jgi:hypothetical protein